MTQNDVPQSPGEFIKAALQERGWTQGDLALIINRHAPAVNEIIQGKRAITPEMAVALGAAFGTGAEVWMNREAVYRLSLIKSVDPEVQRRVRLFDIAPVKDMERRQWIKDTQNVDELEQELCRFFDVASLDQEPRINAAARKTFKTGELNSVQRAWCFRAWRLARTIDAEPFRQADFDAGVEEIKKLADFPEKVRHVPRVLADLGVRLVVIEPLPRSRIDGAAFWIADDAPVIVLSMRYDRIDAFWHTLGHEMSHIKHGDTRSVDSDIVGESREAATAAMEQRAEKEAAAMFIPPDKLRSFIIRVKPFYSKARINQFAHRIGVHPGLVTGQLQHLKEITFATNREMLAKVRDILTKTTLTDGWGHTVPPL